MSYWGKLLGGMAGFAVGGPLGAVTGAALGHAADRNGAPNRPLLGLFTADRFHPARIAAMFAPREQVFAIGIVALSAKLAKCDGPVSRAEIDGFKRHFRIPAESAHEVGRLFDQARDTPDGFEPYANQLGESFADNRGVLEDVLAGLFGIARADGPVNAAEPAASAWTGRHGSACAAAPHAPRRAASQTHTACSALRGRHPTTRCGRLGSS